MSQQTLLWHTNLSVASDFRKNKGTLEDAHYKLSSLPVRAAGFHGRGALLEGWPADVVVYELSKLRRVPEW